MFITNNIVISKDFSVSDFFSLAQKEIVNRLILNSKVLGKIPNNDKLKNSIKRLKRFPKEVDPSAVYSVFRFSTLSKTTLKDVDFSGVFSSKNTDHSVERIEKDPKTGYPVIVFTGEAFVGAINRFLSRFTFSFEKYIKQVVDNKRILLCAKYESCKQAIDAEFNGIRCKKFLPIYGIHWYRNLTADAPRVFIKDTEFVVYDHSNTKIASSSSLLKVLEEDWECAEKKISQENMEKATALVVKGVVSAGGKETIGRNAYTKSSGVEMVTNEYDNMEYAVFRRDRYSTRIIGALPNKSALKAFKEYMFGLADKHECSFYNTCEQFEFGGMYDRKDVWVAPFKFKNERLRHFAYKVKIYGFRGGGKFNNVSSAVKYVERSAKPCIYTFGFESKGPTTHREPISKKEAVNRIKNSRFIDIYEEYATIHINEYSENDML